MCTVCEVSALDLFPMMVVYTLFHIICVLFHLDRLFFASCQIKRAAE